MRSAVKTVAVLGFDESGPLLLPSVMADLIHRRDIVTPHIIASFVPVKHKQLYRENTSLSAQSFSNTVLALLTAYCSS